MIYENDFFISHASEDKSSFVEQLCNALKNKNLNVWYDNRSVVMGDYLPEKIEEGLSNSKYGIVVISTKWLQKIENKEKNQWLQSELEKLLNREKKGEHVIIPIWYGIDEKTLKKYSCSSELIKQMQDRLAGKFSKTEDIKNKEKWDELINNLCNFSLKIKIPPRLSKSKILQEQIAQGSLADIFKVLDKITDRNEAIKILFRQEMREQFSSSVKKAVEISDQPNFISIYEVDFSEYPFFYTMQYIEGNTLRNFIDSDKLALNESREILITLIRAFLGVKKLGLTYGDIKPSNIMVKQLPTLNDSPEYVPFISPFNLLEEFSSDKLKEHLSTRLKNLDVSNEYEKKEYLEMLAYLPPEKFVKVTLDGNSPARSMQYTIGILAYELLTGKFPPNLKESPKQLQDLKQEEGEEFRKMAKQIIDNLQVEGSKIFDELKPENNPIIKENEYCSKFFEEIVLKMMSPNPEKRYSSLEEVLELIEYVDIDLNIAKESYTRCFRNDKFDDNFFTDFYKKLGEKSKISQDKFKHMKTEADWKRQHQQLKQAIFMLFAYYEQNKLFEKDGVPEPNILTDITKTHSRHCHEITEDLYQPFIDTFIETVVTYDPFCQEEKDKENQTYTERVKQAWREVIKPGVKYMKLKYNTSS